jgi:hypothetical protein
MIMQVESSQAVEDIQNKIWRRHNNRETINVTDMVDEYLQSTIAMIKRGIDRKGNRVENDRDAYLPMLEEEARTRGLVPKEDGWDV